MVIGIVALLTSKELTGLGKYIVHLIDGLQKVKSEHEFVIIVNKDFDKIIEIYNPRFKKIVVDIPHNPRIIMRPLFFLWYNLWFGKLLKKYKIQLVHLPNPVPLFNRWCIPHVVTIHDVSEYAVKRYTLISQLLRKIASKSSSKRANQIVTVSEYSKQEIYRFLNISKEEINVIYPVITIRSKITEGVGIQKKENPYFLHIGGTQLNKNLINVANAFLGFKSNIEIDLISIGKGDIRLSANEELLYNKKRGIYYKGYISDVDLVILYQNAFALIFPSTHEGFGLPITEAMAFGVPVVTSNITSMPEVGGDAVHYVDPYSVESIKKGMEKLLSDEPYRRSLIKKGLERYKKFTWEEAAHKTIEVYEKAALQK